MPYLCHFVLWLKDFQFLTLDFLSLPCPGYWVLWLKDFQFLSLDFLFYAISMSFCIVIKRLSSSLFRFLFFAMSWSFCAVIKRFSFSLQVSSSRHIQVILCRLLGAISFVCCLKYQYNCFSFHFYSLVFW